MEFIKTKLDGVILVKPDSYEDFRGSNAELYNEKIYKEGGIPQHFVQDNLTASSKHVLRGIHGDADTWKLASCVHGRIYFVVVNCDQSSPGFGQWESFVLSAENRYQVLVPAKFGNAHLALTDDVMFHYKWSEYYDRAKQFTYRFDDPRFKIWWPVKSPLLAQRDETAEFIK